VMEPLDRSLAAERRRLGPLASPSPVAAAWPGAVGETIARNAWPGRTARDGTLHVTASSSSWAFELGQLEETILERLREALGDAAPARLRFAVGPLPERAAEPAETRAPAPPPAGPQERAEAAAIALAVEDPALRELIARAAAASLVRAAADRRF
jgi:hypothetical protein